MLRRTARRTGRSSGSQPPALLCLVPRSVAFIRRTALQEELGRIVGLDVWSLAKECSKERLKAAKTDMERQAGSLDELARQTTRLEEQVGKRRWGRTGESSAIAGGGGGGGCSSKEDVLLSAPPNHCKAQSAYSMQ